MSDYNLLWNKFRKGDESAFPELIDLFSEMFFRYGLKFIKDEDLVKDCIQDLFIKLYSKRESLPEVSNAKAYLLFSFKNTLRDALRKKNRYILYAPDEMPFVESFELPNENVEDQDDVTKIFGEIINNLSPKQREILYLRYKLELSYDEIAKTLGINYQSARNLIHRTILKIRSNLGSLFFILY